MELTERSLLDRFEELMAADNKLEIQEFLHNQTISDVAELISEHDNYSAQLISSLSLHGFE